MDAGSMDGAPLRRLPRDLDPVELRVLGCLLEKEKTTPDVYPLSVSSLVAACNQKTSREPVMDLIERDVDAALDRLFADVLVWRSDGARVRRWSHNLDRKLGLDPAARAALTLLILRGPQTCGEIKGRADRLHTFHSLAEVEEALDRLADPDDPLVVELPREVGRKEPRWMHRLGGPIDLSAYAAAAASETPRRSSGSSELAERLEAVEQRLVELEAKLAKLAADLGGDLS